jgi:hypothetical protein
MNRFLIATILVLTLWALLLTSGCATLEEKMVEWKLDMVAPWADDKEIMLDPVISCPGCFHLGPLQYDEMLLALRHVE